MHKLSERDYTYL